MHQGYPGHLQKDPGTSRKILLYMVLSPIPIYRTKEHHSIYPRTIHNVLFWIILRIHPDSLLTSLSFTGDSKLASSMRYVETQSMQIGASYMIQFNLVMGCGQAFTPHMDNQVKLEYSTNHGLTWHLVQEVRLSSINFALYKDSLKCTFGIEQRKMFSFFTFQ